MLEILALGILVELAKSGEYNSSQNDVNSTDLVEQSSFYYEPYYSIDCGNGYSRYYRGQSLDEENLCWSSIVGNVLEVLQQSIHLMSGRRIMVGWQYQLNPTHWIFTGERHWCVAYCSAHETSEQIDSQPLPSPTPSGYRTNGVNWNEHYDRLPYDFLVGSSNDIIFLNKSELLRQNPLLFVQPTANPRMLPKRAVPGAMKQLNAVMGDMGVKQAVAVRNDKSASKSTTCTRGKFRRVKPPITCPPGCVPDDDDFDDMPGLGAAQTTQPTQPTPKSDDGGIHGTSPPQHIYIVVEKLVDFIKNIFG